MYAPLAALGVAGRAGGTKGLGEGRERAVDRPTPRRRRCRVTCGRVGVWAGLGSPLGARGGARDVSGMAWREGLEGGAQL